MDEDAPGATSALTVDRTGAGSGTVTSTPAGIACGATCLASFTTGASVTLTAVASARLGLHGLERRVQRHADDLHRHDERRDVGDGDLRAASRSQLSVAKVGTGGGTVTSAPAGIDCGATCQTSVTYSTAVTLTAAAAPGSSFTGWSGACSGTATTCTVTP